MLLMLSQWLQGLSPEFGFLRVFQYLTMRAAVSYTHLTLPTIYSV
mgnify:CR=1 FL=1